MDDDCRDSERRRHGESPSQPTYPSRREPGADHQRRRKEQDQPEQMTGRQRLGRRAAPPGPADSVLGAQVQPADLQNGVEGNAPAEKTGRGKYRPAERLAPRFLDDASKGLTRRNVLRPEVLLLHVELRAP